MEDDESDKGQILVRFCTSSSIHHSHEKRITDIHWLPDYFEVSLIFPPFLVFCLSITSEITV